MSSNCEKRASTNATVEGEGRARRLMMSLPSGAPSATVAGAVAASTAAHHARIERPLVSALMPVTYYGRRPFVILRTRRAQYIVAPDLSLRMNAKLMPAGLDILRWVFWSPETVNPTQWRAAAPAPLDKVPDRDIPAAHRRRMSALSKMAVQVALEATANERADYLVFCSQHGELARTRELLGSIVAGNELSPAGFSQSVHNTSAGLYTIVKESHVPSTSLAAGAGTFAYGWLEAETFLATNPGKTALLVSYDEVLPAEYQSYTRH